MSLSNLSSTSLSETSLSETSLSMSKYSCDRCGKDFGQKSHLDSHNKRKKPCDNLVEKLEQAVASKMAYMGPHSDAQVEENMTTFIELYGFLQKYSGDSILPWLEDAWVGKDKQESLLRLFACLNIMKQLNAYRMCGGNFNENTIVPYECMREIFYNEKNKAINLKDKGDKSDLHGLKIDEFGKKTVLATTSKNLNDEHIGSLDLRDIKCIWHEKYKDFGYELHLCVCIRDKKRTQEMIQRACKENADLKELLLRDSTIIIDWNDLNDSFHVFKSIYGKTPIDSILNTSKTPLTQRMHQEMGVRKTMRLKEQGYKEILWGHVQRSGKSYIIGSAIIADSGTNYLVLTTAPKETIQQQLSVFNHLQFDDFTIIELNGSNTNPILRAKNIIVCSKQFLQGKIENGKSKITLPWLKKMKFDMRFLDESHNGGTTDLARDTLNYYGRNAFTIQITATYTKPVQQYGIDKKAQVLWDLEDVMLCKNIHSEESRAKLVEKHGEDFEEVVKKYSTESIIESYNMYPELRVLTHELKPEIIRDINQETDGTQYGWSPDGAQLLKQGSKYDEDEKKNVKVALEEFQNEEKALGIWYNIFGKKNKYGVPDAKYPDSIVFMERIKKICHNPETKTRFIGDNEQEPTVIMAFLPQNNIHALSNATMKLLEKHNVLPTEDYDMLSINSKTTGDPKMEIEHARIRARNSGKKALLVLSGRQCSLGVSIEHCDVVLLLNNNMAFDMIYQMMFRSMTDSPGKNSGFVIDMNIHRVVKTSVDYATLVKGNCHPKKAIHYILSEKLININPDHWMPAFGNYDSAIDTISNDVYNAYSCKLNDALENTLAKLHMDMSLFSSDSIGMLNTIFSGVKLGTKPKKMLAIEKENIKKGIEQKKVETLLDLDGDQVDGDQVDGDLEQEDEEPVVVQFNPFDILQPLSILASLLTIHDDTKTTLGEMYTMIVDNEDKNEILMAQVVIWWGKKIETHEIKEMISIFIDYMSKDKATEQLIRTVKELFCNNIRNNKELSKVIDKYLVPQELEKKELAEVSTPYGLRCDMLDRLPAEFWTQLRTVFEPCAGKGGFLIDIVDRFMNGLAEVIPDEKERYKTIVEQCLYFSDINKTNIYICRILLDPYSSYDLNFNIGDTLEIDSAQIGWPIGFDAIIGNPPYQVQVGPKKTQPIWNLFTKKSIDMLSTDGYLLYVHPSGWRAPDGVFKDVHTKIMSKNLIYLNMNDFDAGKEVFKVGTNFDYYLMQNNDYNGITVINDIVGKTYELDLKNWSFIPSGAFELFENILQFDEHGEKVNILHDYSTYETRKLYLRLTQDDVYKYPCSYTITQREGLKCYYSSEKRGHFDVPKVIWSNGQGTYPIVDSDGAYGLTQFSYGIIDDLENLENIKIAMNSPEFIKIMKYVMFQAHKYNHKVIGLLKKDFWRDFV